MGLPTTDLVTKRHPAFGYCTTRLWEGLLPCKTLKEKRKLGDGRTEESPAGNYMFKINNRNTREQGVKYAQS